MMSENNPQSERSAGMAIQQQQRTVDAVRLLMRVRGLSVEAMAKAIHLSRSSLHNYFKVEDPSKITLDMLEQMARVLDVPTWLLMQDRAEVMKWLGENPEYGSGPPGITLWPLQLESPLVGACQ